MSIKLIGLLALAGGATLLAPDPNAKPAALDITVVDEAGAPLQDVIVGATRLGVIAEAFFILIITIPFWVLSPVALYFMALAQIRLRF